MTAHATTVTTGTKISAAFVPERPLDPGPGRAAPLSAREGGCWPLMHNCEGVLRLPALQTHHSLATPLSVPGAPQGRCVRAREGACGGPHRRSWAGC